MGDQIKLAEFFQDNSIVGTATPAITNEFDSLTDIGWYGSAYRVTLCSTQFLYGKLYEQFRIKLVFTTAVAILVIGSIVSASAESSAIFILGRAIAGCGSSGLVTGVFITIAHSVPPQIRPIYNSTVGVLECVGMIAGPLIGGAFTTYVSWRWCFWINVPTGGFTLVVVALLFANPTNQKVAAKAPLALIIDQLKLPSLLIFTGSIVCFLLALEWGGTIYSWRNDKIIVLLTVAAVAFVAFAAGEVFWKRHAAIPSSVVFNKTVGLSVLYAFCASAAFSVLDYSLPIWFQAIKSASAARSGVMLLPTVVSLGVAAFSSGFIVSHLIGYYTPLMLIGSALMALGSGFLTTLKPSTNASAWIGWQVAFGLGMGLSIPQPWSATQTALTAEEIPAGMAAVAFAISSGAALFISISQNVFTNVLRQRLSEIGSVNADKIIDQGATDLLENIPISERALVLEVYNFALTRTFWGCVAVACIGFVAAVLMDWNPLKKAKTEEEHAGEEKSSR